MKRLLFFDHELMTNFSKATVRIGNATDDALETTTSWCLRSASKNSFIKHVNVPSSWLLTSTHELDTPVTQHWRACLEQIFRNWMRLRVRIGNTSIEIAGKGGYFILHTSIDWGHIANVKELKDRSTLSKFAGMTTLIPEVARSSSSGERKPSVSAMTTR